MREGRCHFFCSEWVVPTCDGQRLSLHIATVASLRFVSYRVSSFVDYQAGRAMASLPHRHHNNNDASVGRRDGSPPDRLPDELVLQKPPPSPPLLLPGLGPTDVAFGRGNGTNLHPGNAFYRGLVEARRELWRLAGTAAERRRIVEDIVHLVQSQSPPGRFVKENPATGGWVEADDIEVRNKVGAALRYYSGRHSSAAAETAAPVERGRGGQLVDSDSDDDDEGPPHEVAEERDLSVELSEDGLLNDVESADMSIEYEGRSVADHEVDDFQLPGPGGSDDDAAATGEEEIVSDLRNQDFLMGPGGTYGAGPGRGHRRIRFGGSGSDDARSLRCVFSRATPRRKPQLA
jgi:hypothetical protein